MIAPFESFARYAQVNTADEVAVSAFEEEVTFKAFEDLVVSIRLWPARTRGLERGLSLRSAYLVQSSAALPLHARRMPGLRAVLLPIDAELP